MSGNVCLFDNAIVVYLDNFGLVRRIEQLSRKKNDTNKKERRRQRRVNTYHLVDAPK